MVHHLIITYTTLVIGMIYIEGNSHLEVVGRKFL